MNESLLPKAKRIRVFEYKRLPRKKKTKEEINASLHSVIRIIRDTRKLKGITQREFAELTGYSHVHISDVERGHVMPRFNTVINMMNALGLDIRCVRKDNTK